MYCIFGHGCTVFDSASVALLGVRQFSPNVSPSSPVRRSHIFTPMCQSNINSCCNDEFMRTNVETDGEQSGSNEGMKPMDTSEWLEETNKMHIHRADMNKLIMNYLVMEGFKEAAEKFSIEANIKPPMDLDQLDERIRIRSAIQAGHFQEAMRMVTALHPEILDDNSQLYFHLQQQVLIELIREGRVEEAVVYAQDHLAERGQRDPTILNELERTLALLAFDQPDTSPFERSFASFT
ncbi:Glucose-induced degradation complex subunit [Halocaridina rubra]|uniref:Glucose-induced degradation complex subunit n=1 Tax=Halocaridina rubra TaxID=373956 RepID=A0AAN8WX17_HALRR